MQVLWGLHDIMQIQWLTHSIRTKVVSYYKSVWYMAEVALETSCEKMDFKTNYAETIYNQRKN